MVRFMFWKETTLVAKAGMDWGWITIENEDQSRSFCIEWENEGPSKEWPNKCHTCCLFSNPGAWQTSLIDHGASPLSPEEISQSYSPKYTRQTLPTDWWMKPLYKLGWLQVINSRNGEEGKKAKNIYEPPKPSRDFSLSHPSYPWPGVGSYPLLQITYKWAVLYSLQ